MRHAAAPHQTVVLAPGLLVAGIAFQADDLTIGTRREPQSQALDSPADHVGAPDEHRSREALVDDDLRRAHHPIVLALREGYSLLRRFRRGEHRLHAGAGLIHEARHALAIGFKIGERSGGDATVHGRLGNGRRNSFDEARVKWCWYQVVGPEFQTLIAVGSRNNVG